MLICTSTIHSCTNRPYQHKTSNVNMIAVSVILAYTILKNAILDGCNLKCVAFIDVDLSKASIKNSLIDGVTFTNCDLRSSSFINSRSYGAEVTTERLLKIEKDKNRTT